MRASDSRANYFCGHGDLPRVVFRSESEVMAIKTCDQQLNLISLSQHWNSSDWTCLPVQAATLYLLILLIGEMKEDKSHISAAGKAEKCAASN